MGAATFMVFEQQKAWKLALQAKLAAEEAKKAKGKEKKKAEAKAKKLELERKFAKAESKKYRPTGTAKSNEPEEVTDSETHFERGALDLGGDGKPDVIFTPVKK